MNRGLGRFVNAVPSPRPPPPERCEMCGTGIPVDHGHVVDLDHRALMCACRPCYLLFTARGAGRYRAVPQRVLRGPGLSEVEWDELQIPVGMAFVLNGQAFYPSPAGATECLLDLTAWERLVATHSLLSSAEPDVEAILMRRGGDCFLVPVDSCYELVGLVRSTWQGFDGGSEARAAIDGFFARLAERAEVS